MSRKEKVSIIRSEEFASVEEELTTALSGLEDANARIQALLASEAAIMGEPPTVIPDGVQEPPPTPGADRG
jgi:hypothetical protein